MRVIFDLQIPMIDLWKYEPCKLGRMESHTSVLVVEIMTKTQVASTQRTYSHGGYPQSIVKSSSKFYHLLRSLRDPQSILKAE